MKLATKMVPGSVYQPGPELRLPMPEPQPQPQEVAVLPLELRRVAMSKLPSTPQAPVAARAGKGKMCRTWHEINICHTKAFYPPPKKK